MSTMTRADDKAPRRLAAATTREGTLSERFVADDPAGPAS